MSFWTILKIIHSHTPNKNTYNNNNNSQDIHGEQGAKTIHKAVDRNTYKKSNGASIDNDDKQEDENIVKTRYGRTVGKPDKLMYQ